MSVYSNNDLSTQTPNDAWYKIFQYVEPKSRVLDIGCSSGKLGSALREQKDVYIVGIDIDREDVELAKKNLNEAHLLNTEIDNLDFLGKFDTIIFADVIEHLLDPVKTLIKVKSLLKNDGRIIFSIPNMANVTIRLELLKGNFEYKDFGLLDKTHLHFYDHKEVQRIFKKAGLQIETTDCTLREIPDDILAHELKPIGIQLNPKLIEVLNSKEAVTYQFIGYAKPSNKIVDFTPNTTSPLDSVSRQIDEINKNYEHETKLRDVELDRRAARIKQIDERVQSLEQEINEIHSSKAWRAVTKVSIVRSKIFKK